MKEYSAFPKAPASLEPHHQIVSCHIQDTIWWGPTPLQRSGWYILLPQPNEQALSWWSSHDLSCPTPVYSSQRAKYTLQNLLEHLAIDRQTLPCFPPPRWRHRFPVTVLCYWTILKVHVSSPLMCLQSDSGWVWRYYLPTPPLGQDMTQGQFLSGV